MFAKKMSKSYLKEPYLSIQVQKMVFQVHNLVIFLTCAVASTVSEKPLSKKLDI